MEKYVIANLFHFWYTECEMIMLMSVDCRMKCAEESVRNFIYILLISMTVGFIFNLTLSQSCKLRSCALNLLELPKIRHFTRLGVLPNFSSS